MMTRGEETTAPSRISGQENLERAKGSVLGRFSILTLGMPAINQRSCI